MSGRDCETTLENVLRCLLCIERHRICNRKQDFLVWAVMCHFNLSEDRATQLYIQSGFDKRTQVGASHLSNAPSSQHSIHSISLKKWKINMSSCKDKEIDELMGDEDLNAELHKQMQSRESVIPMVVRSPTPTPFLQEQHGNEVESIEHLMQQSNKCVKHQGHSLSSSESMPQSWFIFVMYMSHFSRSTTFWLLPLFTTTSNPATLSWYHHAGLLGFSFILSLTPCPLGHHCNTLQSIVSLGASLMCQTISACDGWKSRYWAGLCSLIFISFNLH